VDEELKPSGPAPAADLAAAAATVARHAAAAQLDGRMPAVYLGHGAPPLVDDALWVAQLAAWAGALPRPTAILMVSAHWEAAPTTLGATRDGVPLTYDFYGFPERYYRTVYPAPAAPGLAARLGDLLASGEQVAQQPERGLDHGAYVPLLVMYPKADVPVLQISLPSLEPARLLELGARLRPLRDEGVLVVGSGFLTHGLPFLRDFRTDAPPPAWSSEFDQWAAATLAGGDLDALAAFRDAPGGRYAHPTTEHFVPLFVTLGAGGGAAPPVTMIEGYYLGLSKRSVQVA
jgi:4,5-DOPA dioxygenase extradiol